MTYFADEAETYFVSCCCLAFALSRTLLFLFSVYGNANQKQTSDGPWKAAAAALGTVVVTHWEFSVWMRFCSLLSLTIFPFLMVKDYSVSETTAAAAVGTIIWPLAKISFIYSLFFLCLPSPIGRSLICAHLLTAAAAAAAEPSRSHFKSL